MHADRNDYPGLIGGQYRPLNQDRVGRIHETSLRILEEVGVQVEDDEAREIFRSAGADVSLRDGRVRIGCEAVERALRLAPSRIVLCGRDADHDLILKGRRTHFGTGGAAVNVVDLESGNARPSRLSDIADFARLVEALPNIHFFVRPCAAQDVPKESLGVNELYAGLRRTSKHTMAAAYSPGGAENILEMGRILAGSEEALRARPFFSIIVGWMQSPLTFSGNGSRTLLKIVRGGLPVTLSSAPMAGGTSPITLAGTLVQLHAEELAGIVFVQLARPGAPVIYGGIPSMADMRYLRYIGGGVEFGMMNAAIAQLSRYINVPNYNSAGVTEAKISDIQAVYEKSFAILQCALSGSNCIHHAAGMLESLLTVSHEQLIIDNEIIGMAMRAIRGIEVDEDRLAFKTIREAGPGGDFLSANHTVRFMRSEFFEPALADRSDRRTWESLGMEGILEKANRKAKDILARREPCRVPIPEELDKRIRGRFDIRDG